MTDQGSRSDINISRIFVGGVGGIGLVMMAALVAYFLEPLRWPAVVAIVGGAALGLSLIAMRHRPARKYAVIGLVVLGLALLIGLFIGSLEPVSAASHGPQAAQPGTFAQSDVNQRLDLLVARLERLERRGSRSSNFGILFLVGVMCALWAQNTKRDPWLWFFLGALFNVFALISLLIKNGEDQGRNAEPETGTRWAVIGGFVLLIALTFVFFYWSSFR